MMPQVFKTGFGRVLPNTQSRDTADEADYEPILQMEESAEKNDAPSPDSRPQEPRRTISLFVCAILLAWAVHFELQKPMPVLRNTLAIYAYTESPMDYENARFFVDHGYHDQMDWLFLQRGAGKLADLTKDLARSTTVQVQADCLGWAAATEALRTRQGQYDSFIFINSNIRGPFVPYWAHEKKCWSHEYLRLLSRETKLVGMTYGCTATPHMQSHLFATDTKGLALLLKSAAFKTCAHSPEEEAVLAPSLSQSVQLANYREDVMMLGYHNSPAYSSNCSVEDPMGGPNAYFGFDLNPLETFFIKPGGGWTEVGLQHYTDWLDVIGWNAKEPCRALYDDLNARA